MHGLYHFLINLEDETTVDEAAQGQFASIVENTFDDNNWHTPLALAIKGGAVDISKDDYRGGFDAWVSEDEREGWDFDAAMAAAYKAVYWEINSKLNLITNSEYAYDREFESIEQAADVIRQTLAISYAEENGEALEDWKLYARPKLAKTYEHMRDSKYFNAPFFNPWEGFNPYNARAFDLTEGEEYGLAILTVDIHT